MWKVIFFSSFCLLGSAVYAAPMQDSAARNVTAPAAVKASSFFVAGSRLYTPVSGSFAFYDVNGRLIESLYLEADASLDLADIAHGFLVVRNENRARQVIIP